MFVYAISWTSKIFFWTFFCRYSIFVLLYPIVKQISLFFKRWHWRSILSLSLFHYFLFFFMRFIYLPQQMALILIFYPIVYLFSIIYFCYLYLLFASDHRKYSKYQLNKFKNFHSILIDNELFIFSYPLFF